MVRPEILCNVQEVQQSQKRFQPIPPDVVSLRQQLNSSIRQEEKFSQLDQKVSYCAVC